MRARIIQNLKARFDAYDELIGAVDDGVLKAEIDVPKHKTLSAHLWCVVGARQSYARALEAGKWAGFNNAMTEYSCIAYEESLASSARNASAIVDAITDWTAERDELLASLYEHEVMHEGQIIRHMYALEKTLPASWRWA